VDRVTGRFGNRLYEPGNTQFWPVDKVILGYFALSTLLLLVWWRGIPLAPWLCFWHVAGTAVLLFEIKRPNPTSWVFRNWYALPYVASCYKEMAAIIPAAWKGKDADLWLATLDYRIWGAHPTVWLERFQSAPFTELLQCVYTAFVPAVLLVAFLTWRKRQFADFQFYAFLIALGFLASYIGYLFVPARGPRFLLRNLQHIPLQGMWFFGAMQHGLDELESAHYDCFPSGHTALTILAWWGSQVISRSIFRIYFAYTALIIFATVYLRYHYTVDLAAGMLLALILILAAPVLYRKFASEA
jgi:membrane-associated phospholipid phosphatase